MRPLSSTSSPRSVVVMITMMMLLLLPVAAGALFAGAATAGPQLPASSKEQRRAAFATHSTFVKKAATTTTTTTTTTTPVSTSARSSPPSSSSSWRLGVGDARGEYYGESSGSYMVKEFNTYDQLREIVSLASQPLPERPDGIVSVAKFTAASDDSCRMTEAEYERMARKNPATIFLRCFAEYDDAHVILGQADVTVYPTFDIFYQGNRVARVEGNNHVEVEELLDMYQFQNTQLDLFSEKSERKWGDGQAKDMTKTPRTTARFVPGYDWNKDSGFFDDLADRAQSDFENQYGNWLPVTDDDDTNNSKDGNSNRGGNKK